jgi:two-component system, NtrC family, sensor kinase
MDADLTKPAGRAAGRPVPKWHLIYYLLAAFDLATVGGSLFLNHRLMAIYTNSVEVNQGWAGHLAALTDLGQKAGAVNAPGNNVFDSHDASREVQLQKAALADYHRLFARMRADILRDATPHQSLELNSRLDDIQAAMSDMLAEAEAIFAYFRKGQAEAAGRHMASMDRKFANLSTAIAATAQSVRAIQSELFRDQVAEAAFLRRFEYLFGGMILLMVGCVTIYGHKIASEFKRGEQERAKYLEALRAEEQSKLALERRLRQSQKLDALGTLAGGMAHEFNNILTPMIGLAKLTMRATPLDSVGHDNLQKVVESGERAKKLVGQVLNFSREKQRENKVVSLAAVVHEVLGILRPTAPSNVVIRDRLDATRDRVRADPTELHQVLMNLVVNATHAIKGRAGEIDVGLVAVALAPDEAAALGVAGGDYVRLSVKDNGSGMDDATKVRIFEPFFTTKGVGEGTGLGLAVVHGIVADHGGAIAVTSAAGQGTRFDVYLPIAAADANANDGDAGNEVRPGAPRKSRVLPAPRDLVDA